MKKMVVLLIKPSQYDENGFVYRFHRQVLPSPSIGVLHALTKRALKDALPSGIATEVHLLEDGISSHASRLRRMEKRFPEQGTVLVVGLVGVQTAQFPRSCDIARAWQARGAVCIIGGPHVTASITTLYDGVSGIPCPKAMPPEIQAFMDEGGVIFHGEAEPECGRNVWAELLSDIWCSSFRQLYRGGRPDITDADFPDYGPLYRRGAFVPRILPVQLSRGCPYACEFCAVVNMLGRKVRYRDPEKILEYVKGVCLQEGKASFFFTDDNFVRSPSCEKVLEGLTDLRRQGYELDFMIQGDMRIVSRLDIIRKLADAGCGQIFFGVESLDPQNLAFAGKTQNAPEEYEALWRECNRCGIVPHASYIIGFPHDTPQSVISSVDDLVGLGAGQGSFFMLDPVPGSADHARMVESGDSMDADLNRYDSTYAVTDHPNMSRREWEDAFHAAYCRFYSAKHMITMLKRMGSREKRVRLLCNFLWYWWSVHAEKTHPMIAGFLRQRCWRDRRTGVNGWKEFLGYVRMEAAQPFRYLGWFLVGFYIFQHVLFETEFTPALKEKGYDRHGLTGWFRLTFGRYMSRSWLNDFWIRYGRQRWQLLNPMRFIWHVRAIPYAITEVVYTMRMWLMVPYLVRVMESRE